MQIDKTASGDSEEEKQDIELENLLGNLMIAQFQVDKLRTRIADRISSSISNSNNSSSTSIYKHNGKWYKVLVKVDQVDISTKNYLDSEKEV